MHAGTMTDWMLLVGLLSGLSLASWATYAWVMRATDDERDGVAELEWKVPQAA